MTPISKFPTKEVFAFIEPGTEDVYAFHAPELHYAICKFGAVNPFTRQRIPFDEIHRLHSMMTTIPWKQPVPNCSDEYLVSFVMDYVRMFLPQLSSDISRISSITLNTDQTLVNCVD